MKKIITFLTTVFLTGCSAFGVRTASEPNYQVLKDYDSIQIRHYQALLVAQTEVIADYKTSSNQAFQRLAGYIFGKNISRQKIPMTAPVIQVQQSQVMKMTAPVIQEKSGVTWVMAFVLPKTYTLATSPIPTDSTIKILEIPDKKVAVIQYSGNLSEQGIKAKSDQLHNWLSLQGYISISPPRSAAYDPPWTLPFLRRNEIHIEIQ